MAQRQFGKRTDDELYQDWSLWISRAAEEGIAQAWRSQMFRLMRGVYQQNTELQERGGFLVKWMADNYIDASAIAFRRELDTQGGTENLYHLLDEMSQRPHVVNRARFRATWHGDPTALWNADMAFEQYRLVRNGNQEEDHVDPGVVAGDKAGLASLDDVLKYVQMTVAHRVPKTANTPLPTLGDFHDAIKKVRELILFYCLLLTHKGYMDLETTAQYDTFAAFTFPWISDKSGFDYTQCEYKGIEA